ncbi:MAG: tandem-95 repeat protein [Minwuia sp.]|nr:tandem-95 repeat protein [Minwuia sp.]
MGKKDNRRGHDGGHSGAGGNRGWGGFDNSGDDTLVASGANAKLDGGNGDDVLIGAGGNDRLYGGRGDDSISAGDGRNQVDAGDGNDTVSTGQDDDRIYAGRGDDTVASGDGRDRVDGGSGNDTIDGGGDRDTVDGGTGNDSIIGGGGDDSLSGGSGDDTISGGEGHDRIHGGDGNDLIDGDAGRDRAYGGNGDDTINGGGGDDTLSGGRGDDLIDGGDGDDQIHSDRGDDTLIGGAGDDLIHGDRDDDVIRGDGDGFGNVPGPAMLQQRANGTYDIQGLESVVLTVDFLGGSAGFDNSFGYYLADADGNPVDGQIIFRNVKCADDDAGDDVRTISLAADELDGAVSLGFFLVPNGADRNSRLRDGDEVSFRQDSQGDWQAISNGRVLNSAYGRDTVFFSDAGLNKDGLDHEVDNSLAGNSAWEDLLGGGDNDFNDATFQITVLDGPQPTFNDRIHADRGNDLVNGDRGDDFIDGGHGNDTLQGGTGDDTIDADRDDDLVIHNVTDNQGFHDIYDGGKGHDTLELQVTEAELAVLADDIAAFQDVLADNGPSHGHWHHHGNDDRAFDFEAIGLSARNFEALNLTIVNFNPDAVDDAVVTDEDTALLIDVLANDADADGNSLTITAVTQPGNGTVEIVGNRILFTPNDNYNGPDSFTYTVFDGVDGFDTATVSLTINPVNDAPVAADDAITVVEDTTTVIDVLANDVDIDGDALTVTSATALNGTVAINADSTLSYTPNGNYHGTDTISYTISDGGLSTSAVVSVTVTNDGTDVLFTDSNDTIDFNAITPFDYDDGNVSDALAGDDLIILPTDQTAADAAGFDSGAPFDAGSGDDTVIGGDLGDTVIGGDGADSVDGGTGDDSLSGGQGSDSLTGGEGDDTLDGGDDADVLSGGAGADSIVAGSGDDSVDAGDDADFVDAGDGNDSVAAGADDDTVAAGDGDDTVSAGNGNDNVSGGIGDDLVLGEAGSDTLSGGDGDDTLDGGTGDDLILGEAGNDTLSGGDGDDTLDGGEDGDVLSGGAGADSIAAGSGDDTIDAGDDADIVDAGDGNDSVEAGAGDDTVSGGAGNDQTDGGEGDDVLSGEAGNDSISGGDGNDALDGGDGDDLLDAGDGNDVVDGGAGNDAVDAGAGDDAVSGGDGNDTLTGGDGNDTLLGGAGNDAFFGGTGDDSINGGDGTDNATFTGNADEYDVTFNDDGTVTITDTVPDRDGTTTLENVETAAFADDIYFTDGTNNAPEASDETATTDEDTAVNIDVLANDSDFDSDPLTVTSATADNGSVVIGTDGTVTYTGNADFNGTDTISYTIDDGRGGTDTAEVAVTVNAINDAPVITVPTGGALRFDGNPVNHVQVAHDADLSPTSWTVEAWVTTTDADGQFNRVVTKPVGGQQTYSLVVRNGEAHVRFDDATLGQQFVQAGFVADGQPHHIAGVYDNASNSLSLYVDGAQVGSITTTGTPRQGTEELNIGRFNDGFGQGFVGDVSEVRIWSAPRTAAEIAGSFDQVLDSANEPDLELYMTFDPTFAEPGRVQDLSGHDFDGTIFGAPLRVSGGTPVDQTIQTEVGQEVRFFGGAVADVDLADGGNQMQVTVAATNGTIDVSSGTGATITGDRSGFVTLTGTAAQISLSLSNMTFTPDAGFIGAETVTITADDLGNAGAGGPQTDTESFTILVVEPNVAPEAVDDTAVVDEDGSISIDVLANDTDDNGDDLTVTEATALNGAVVIGANGTLAYTPTADFSGTDTISYTITDGNGEFDSAEVAVTVNPVADAPVIAAPVRATSSDEFVVNTTTAGDQDQASLTALSDGGFLVTWDQGNGGVSESGRDIMARRYDANGDPVTGEFEVTTADGTNFMASSAELTDGGYVILWSSGVASDLFLRIYDGNDQPVSAPTLVNDSPSEQRNPEVIALDGGGFFISWRHKVGSSETEARAQRFDASGNTSGGEIVVSDTFAVTAGPVMQSMPDGGILFTYLAGDGANRDVYAKILQPDGAVVVEEFRMNASSTGDQVQPDAVVLSDGSFMAVWASDDTVDGSRDIVARKFASDGSPLGSEVIVNSESIGTQQFPNITRTATDKVLVTWTTELGGAIGDEVRGQLLDLDGNRIGDEIEINQNTAGDQFARTGDHGSRDTITLSDGRVLVSWNSGPGSSDDEVVARILDFDGNRLDVVAIEDSPIELPVGVTLSDTDGSEVIDSIVISGVPVGGSLSAGSDLGGGQWLLTEAELAGLQLNPPVDFNGSITLEITATSRETGNGDTASASRTFSMEVDPVNDIPVAADDATTTDEDVVVSIDVLANDSDVDGDLLTVTSASANNGTVVIETDGSLTYTPDTDFNGSDTISYTIDDGNGGTDSASVTVTVNTVNDAPVATDDAATTEEDTAVSIDVLGNDADADGDALTVTSATANNGTVVIEANGSLTYTPDADFNGSDTISYAIDDGNGGSAEAQVAVTVSPVNDAPVLQFGGTGNQVVDLADVSAGLGGFVIQGNDTGDLAGRSIHAAGDVNNDGIEDIVMGIPFADPGGDRSGQAIVVFGNNSGVNVDISDVIAGNGGFAINGARFLDAAGFSVSDLGDLNGDGFDDLLVSSHRTDKNGNYAGSAHVVFGKADGTPVSLTDVESGIGGFNINGAAPHNQTGVDLSRAGDVNGDGLEDLFISAHGDATNGYLSGASYVVFGRTTLSDIELSDVAAGDGGFIIRGSNDYDHAGLVLDRAGDVNGDGLDDVIVGAPGADTNGLNSGAAFVIFGKADTAPVQITSIGTTVGGFVIAGGIAGENAGGEVAGVGDVNGDGFDDLFVGSSNTTVSVSGNGDGYVVFGKADSSQITLADVAALGQGFLIEGDEDAQTGIAAAGIGDINGDGLADLLLGAPGDDTGGTDAGGAFVVLGKGDGSTVSLAGIAAGTENGLFIQGADANGRAGDAVGSVSDLNGDGISELLIGAPNLPNSATSGGSGFAVFTPDLSGTTTDFSSVSPLEVGEDNSLVVTGVSISDIDVLDGTGEVEAELSVANGVLDVSETGALVTGDGTGSVTVTGALADVNAAIGSVTYAPDANYNGTDSLQITVSDLGNTGSGGPLTDLETIQITVNAVNDAPEIDASGSDLTSDLTVGFVRAQTLDANDLLANFVHPVRAATVIDEGGQDVLHIGSGGITRSIMIDIPLFTVGELGAEDRVTILIDGVIQRVGGDQDMMFGVRDSDQHMSLFTTDGVIGGLFSDAILGDGSLGVAFPENPPSNDRTELGFGSSVEDFTVRLDLDGNSDRLTLVNGNGTPLNLSGDAGPLLNADDDLFIVIGADQGGESYEIVSLAFSAEVDGLVDSGSITFTDVDAADVHSAAVTNVTTTGSTNGIDAATFAGFLTLGAVTASSAGSAGSVNWTFGADDALFDYLRTGDSLELAYQVTVDDNAGGTDSETVTVTINGRNDGPVAADDSATTDEDTAVAITVLANDSDVDGDALTVISATANNGSVVIEANGTLTYTPDADFNGSDTISYVVSDGELTDTAQVAVTVNAVNDAPVTVDDIATTDEDTAVTINVLGNDTDIDGDALAVTAATAGNGTVVVGANGSLTYTPDADFNGTDTIDYVISDGELSDTAQVAVTVNAVNDAPVAVDDAVTVDEDTSVVINVLGNDNDGDGDALTVTAASAANGSVVIESDGSLTYTGNQDFNGTDTISYTVNDGNGGTDTAEVAVTVNAVNDAPVLQFASAELGSFDVAEMIAGDGGFVMFNNSFYTNAGFAVDGAGDVNGDGLSDLLVTERRAAPDGLTNAGAGYVVFGKADGDQINLADVAAGIGGFAVNGSEAGGLLGREISAAGDVNGDGLADFIISSPNLQNGTAYVVFGKADGTPINADQLENGIGGFAIRDNSQLSSGAGSSVSNIGDLNGDGLDDLLVGSASANYDAGAVYVVFGKEDGATVDLADIEAETGNLGFAMNGTALAETVRGAGISIDNAGDVNGDGLNDIIIGTPNSNTDGIQGNEGGAFVVFGKSDSATVELGGILAGGGGGFAIYSNEGHSTLGATVAGAGDINGDGLADLMLSEHQAFDNGQPVSKTYVVFGKSDTAEVLVENIGTEDAGFVVRDSGPNSSRAVVSAAGDLNGDGLDDLLIGQRNTFAPGDVAVIFGKADSAQVEIDDIRNEDGGFIITANTLSLHSLGYSLAQAGDVNGDGFDDLIVGAFTASIDAPGTYGGGAIVIFAESTIRTDFSLFPTVQLAEDSSVEITTIGISDIDVDEGTGQVEAVLTVGNGSIDVTDTGAAIQDDGTGTVTVAGTLAEVNGAIGSLVYTPDADFNGTDSLQITVNDLGNTGDGGPLLDTEAVQISISAVADGPVAADDSVTTEEDVAVSIDVLGNDSDGDGDALTVTAASAANGSVVIGSDGSLTYTGNQDFNGTDTITYIISDGGLTDTAEVTVTVNAVNDAPLIDAGGSDLSSDLTVGFTRAETLDANDLLANFVHPFRTATVVDEGAQDVLHISTRPGSGFDRLVMVEIPLFTVGELDADSRVTINIDGLIQRIGGDQDIAFGVRDTDQHLSFFSSDGGTGLLLADALTGNGPFGIASPENPPLTERTVPAGSQVEDFSLRIDLDGDSDRITLVQGNGAVFDASSDPGTYIDTQDAVSIFIGSDQFHEIYEIVSLGFSAEVDGLVDSGSIAFTDVDAADVHSAAVTNVTTTGSTNGIDAATFAGFLTLGAVTASSAGSAGSVNWTFGADDALFDYLRTGDSLELAYQVTVDDNAGGTDSETVTVTINGRNDGPVAADDSATTDEDTAVAITVLANDSDVDGDALTVISATANNGSVVIEANGTLTYTPDADFNGSDTISYVISDGELTDTAQVAVTVNAVADRQVVSGPVDAGSVDDGDAPVAIDLLANAFDADGDDLDVQGVTVTSSSAGRTVAFTVDQETGELVVDPTQFSDLLDGQSETVTVDYAVSDDSADFTDSIGSPNVPNGGVTYVIDFDDNSTFTFVRSSGPFLPVAQEPVNGAYVHLNPNNGFSGSIIVRTFMDGVETTRDASELTFENYGGTVNGGGFSGAFSNSTIDWTVHDLVTADGERCVSIRLEDISHFTGDGLTVGSANFVVTTDVAAQATLEVAGVTRLVFTNGDDTVDLNNVVAADADDGNVSNAGDGRDIVTLADNATEAAEAGFIVGQTFFGGAGDDNITGGDLDDVIDGGADNDLILSGAGNDTIFSGDGNNFVRGETGDDSIIGGSSRDSFFGDEGNDTISGGGSRDTLRGGDGNDSLLGEAGEDGLFGGNGDDTLLGGDGFDELFGDAGADVLNGGTRDDTLSGGDGADTLTGGTGADQIDGGSGTDVVDFSTEAGPIDLNLTAGISIAVDGAVDTLSNVEIVIGTAGNDSLTGTANSETLFGGDGNDILAGIAGNDDSLNGGNGNDTLFGSDIGDDTLNGGAGDDILDGGASNAGDAGDTADYTDDTAGVAADLSSHSATDGFGDTDQLLDIEHIDGSAFNDTLTGDSNANVLSGGAGEDTLQGNLGEDTLFGGDGNDSLLGDSVFVDASDAADFLFGGDGDDTLNGGENDGADVLDGGAGADVLAANGGDDTMIGGSGNDTMSGGAGDDVFVFSTGDGADRVVTFTAGAGTEDVLDFTNDASITGTGDLTFGDDGAGNATVGYGTSDLITLIGVVPGSLDNDDFLF